ncbi:MAG: class I SAM-dependent methyltransferase [Planctomycetes bacterium]|nr:class I SAM-dependent methyltransferase [Planctomycetota bacterium]
MAIAITAPIKTGLISDGLLPCVGCQTTRPIQRPVLRANGRTLPFDLHRCTECGLVQQFPRATAARLSAHYDSDYYVFKEEERLRWSRAVQQYCVHLRPMETRAPKRLLDVGCALGHMCAIAKRRGWRVSGLDLSAEAVSQAVVRFGIDARAGRISQYRSTMPRFDAIMLGDVIEHVDDPAAFLKDVRNCLAPGGVVCIDTPNWGGWWRRLGRSDWLGINPFHVNLFDARSIGTLLAKNGMRVESMTSYTHYRYGSLARRPEIQRLTRALPSAVVWRMNAVFSRFASLGRWAGLRTSQPATLDEAMTALDRLSKKGAVPVGGKSGDNLAVLARLV